MLLTNTYWPSPVPHTPQHAPFMLCTYSRPLLHFLSSGTRIKSDGNQISYTSDSLIDPLFSHWKAQTVCKHRGSQLGEGCSCSLRLVTLILNGLTLQELRGDCRTYCSWGRSGSVLHCSQHRDIVRHFYIALCLPGRRCSDVIHHYSYLEAC